MSFDWVDLLRLAEALESAPDSPGPPEAALRSAVSRAYYAAFHCALNLASKEGFVPSYSGDDHQKVQAHFRNSSPSDSNHRKIAVELGRLYRNRCAADYDDALRSQPGSLASLSINMARSVLSKLNSIPNS